eukprot:870820-Rhodomonas_salina.2
MSTSSHPSQFVKEGAGPWFRVRTVAKTHWETEEVDSDHGAAARDPSTRFHGSDFRVGDGGRVNAVLARTGQGRIYFKLRVVGDLALRSAVACEIAGCAIFNVKLQSRAVIHQNLSRAHTRRLRGRRK